MRKLLVIAAGISVLLLGLFVISLVWLGPIGMKIGEERILARQDLLDGDKLFVVTFRTKSLGEPYLVRLYRVEPSGKVAVNFLEYEEGYWWGCSLRPTIDGGKIIITALGTEYGTYDTTNRLVVWNDKNRPTSTSFEADAANESLRIPKVILEQLNPPRQP